jgi:S1-C subfamily serine protease
VTKRLILGCAVAVVALGVLAAGLAALFIYPAFKDSERLDRVQMSLEPTAAAPGEEAASSTVPDVTTAPLERARQVARRDVAGLPSLPLADEATRMVPDLATLFAATNPGVVSISVVRSTGDLEVGAAGSGWVFDDKHVVTNHHVVEGASEVSVTFADGTEVAAQVVATDDDTDLAVVAVAQMPPSARALPLVEDFDAIKVGEPVVAIGNPFGFNNTITAGIVSALGRIIPSGLSDGAGTYSIPQTIQTDAAINPGNSGGPLLNMRGEVVGINAQIRTEGVAVNSGVGFAIPAPVVRLVVPELIAHGGYTWPYLGVQGTSMTLAVAKANGLDTTSGAYITAVVPGGPSDGVLIGAGAIAPGAAGVRRIPTGGDVVVEADGKSIHSFEDLLSHVALETRPGDEVRLTVLRGGERREVTVKVGERPS